MTRQPIAALPTIGDSNLVYSASATICVREAKTLLLANMQAPYGAANPKLIPTQPYSAASFPRER
ncbi:hypothetical protein HRbin36_00406 [bacterium HR36]|nr:hypothetical protein HRbin36_00406 [bacterium HR36]